LYWILNDAISLYEIRLFKEYQPLLLGKRKHVPPAAPEPEPAAPEPEPAAPEPAATSLTQKLLNQGFTIRSVEEDGNCFFKSIAILTDRDHVELREEIVETMLIQYDNQTGVFEQEEYRKDVDRADILSLRKDGVWKSNAMDYVPLVTSKYLKLKIVIHYADGGERVIKVCKLQKKTVHVLFAKNHYSVLERCSHVPQDRRRDPTVYFYKIVDERKQFGVVEKKIHWCGFSEEEDIWIAEDELQSNDVSVEEMK
jgi:hypothetical protein